MPNARPSASFDYLQVTELDAISGNLLANDSDPDGQPLFLRFVGGVRIDAKHGPDHITLVEGTHGTFSFKPDGSFTYVLNPEVAESLTPGEMVIEQLPYKISDGLGSTDVDLLRLEIRGAVPDMELKTIDFEDLEPGLPVPEGYQGFDWGDGWIIDTDEVGEMGLGNRVAQPTQSVDMIRLVDGADFNVVELVLNGEMTGGPHSFIEVRGYNDGVPHPFYVASIGSNHPEPTLMDLQWEGIDALEITHDPAVWIDEITVVVPAV